MNRIILIGNLTRDPESSSTQSGVNFTRFTIAVNRPFTDSNGNRPVDYFDILCWRQLADRCGKYLFKGSKVGINGSVQRRQYEDRNGIKRTTFDIVADEVEFLSKAQQQNDGLHASSPQQNPSNPTAQRAEQAIDGLVPVPQEEADDLPF